MTLPASSRLKFIVCGNVDDGKSTLIGRLLVDTDSLFVDQMEELKKTSQVRQNVEDPKLLNFALVTDGLKSEREQGITIDVAYRFFSTEKRSFCIIDVPGHAQYLRNMFTGATNADVALLLVDSKNGISDQTRRHLLILSLVGMKQVIVVINKMDMMNYDEGHFQKLVKEVTTLANGYNLKQLTFVPLSSLRGDNLIHLSDKMPWYKGQPLLTMLENFKEVTGPTGSNDAFEPIASIQGVIRSGDERFYMTNQIQGKFKTGEAVKVFPSEMQTTVKNVSDYNIQVTGDLDLDRGALVVSAGCQLSPTDEIKAVLCWFTTATLKKSPYLFSFCSNSVRCSVSGVLGEYDIQTGNIHEKTNEFALNDLIQLEIKLSKPLLCSSYLSNKQLGTFLLIDPLTNQTVAAGMII